MSEKNVKNPFRNGKKVEAGIWENLNPDGTHDGTYSVRISRRFNIDKTRKSYQLFMRRRRILTLAQAKREKRKIEDILAAKAIKLQNGDKTWKEARDQYEKYLQNRLSDQTMAHSTYDNVVKTLNKHTSQWNNKMITWFNIEVLESYLNSQDLKSEASHTTRKNILKFIRQVFKRQMAIGAISHNPTNGVHIRKSISEIDQNQPDREPVFMSKEDFYKVLDYAKEYFPDWAEVYEVGFHSGLRSGELFSLKWSNVIFDVNIKKCRVDVKTSYDWKTEKVIQMTKGKKDRVVPMSPSLLKILRELKIKSTSDFVLPRIQDWKNGKAAEFIRNVQRAVEVRPTKFHALRGSFCTNLLLGGVPPIIVQKMLGHSSFKTTQHYISLVGLDLQGSTDCLERTVIPFSQGQKKTGEEK